MVAASAMASSQVDNTCLVQGVQDGGWGQGLKTNKNIPQSFEFTNRPEGLNKSANKVFKTEKSITI